LIAEMRAVVGPAQGPPKHMRENQSMRVLHVITGLGVGGAEHMLLKLLRANALAGFEQGVVAMLPGGAMVETMRATGAAVEELNFLGGLPLLGGASQLAMLTRRHPPDLVHGWMYHGNLGAALARAALRRRVPLVWSIRQSLPSLDGENAFARAGIHLNRALSSLPDCLLFNSLAGQEQHRSFGFRMQRAHYLPNGFDTAHFAADALERARLRVAWGADGSMVMFGVLARHHPVKDHVGFLQAARRTLDARAQARFVLAGTGMDAANAALMQTIADAGLAGRVLLMGERRDAAAVLSALDVCVSSSLAEAFSNTVGEAMSCGLPCVVTAVGDSAQLIGNSGRSVPPRDPAALAAAMVAMIDLGAAGRAELGARARQRIEAEFGIDAVARRHAELYRQLAAGAQPRA